MKTKMIAAAAIVALSAGGAWATTLEPCSAGQLRNWNDTGTTTGGSETTTSETVCYTGGSGNEVDCDRSGNLVAVTISTTTIQPGFAILQQPGQGNTNQCLGAAVGETTTITTCDISRTMGVGGIDFEYCADYNM